MTVEVGNEPATDSEEFAAILSERRITTVFQPLVNVATREIVGYEAFCRGPEGSRFASPANLFRQAEIDGLQSDLNWVCLGSAFEAFFSVGVPRSTSLFVNVSVGLRIDQCPPDIYQVVARAQSSLRVFIEFNDAALASDPYGVLATVDRARRLGWGVSVDDVSSSPGCLSVLPLMSADVVKLDMRVLKRDEQGDVAPSIGPLLKYVENTDVTFVVSGIESAAEARLARALGATVGQGYHFGAPGRLAKPISAPRTPIPLLGVSRHSGAAASPWEIVKSGPTQNMSSQDLLTIAGVFIRQAIVARARPVVLIRQANGLALGSLFEVGALDKVSENAVLCAIFGPRTATGILPRWRRVVVPGGDPLRNQVFLVLLTDSITVGIVATRLIEHDDLFDVFFTQEPETVHRLAEHLIRRMPMTDGDEIIRFDRGGE